METIAEMPALSRKQRILEVLRRAHRPLAVHEFGLLGISENALSARLRELQALGVISGSFREGKPFKEWRINA